MCLILFIAAEGWSGGNIYLPLNFPGNSMKLFKRDCWKCQNLLIVMCLFVVAF